MIDLADVKCLSTHVTVGNGAARLPKQVASTLAQFRGQF
jgi:hypothetical protein